MFLILVTSTCIVNPGNCGSLRNNFPMCPWIILQLSYEGTFVHIIYSIVFPQRWKGDYHRASTYPGKSDNNEICSLIPFFGVIILYPKSISWALEFTNNFYKNFQLRYIHVRSDSYIYGQVLCQICKDPEVWLSNLQIIPKAQLWGWGNLDICI